MRSTATLISKRIAQLIPVVLGVSLLSFSLLNLLPGGAAIAILGSNATPQLIAEVNKELGLNHPFWYRYGDWLWHALHGDLGNSLASHLPVSTLISQRLSVTVELLLLAILISLVSAVIAALLAARHPGGVADWVTRSTSMFGLSMPNFVFAFLGIIVFAVKLSWLPVTGFVPLSQGIGQNLRHLILPALSIALVQFASWSRVLRGDLVDQERNEEYVLIARSKGLGRFHILRRHVLKNALFSMITIVGSSLGTLIGGSVIIENVFGLPGMGQLLQSSIYQRDAPVVQGIVIVVACAVVIMNLLCDILYMVLDPRVRYGSVE